MFEILCHRKISPDGQNDRRRRCSLKSTTLKLNTTGALNCFPNMKVHSERGREKEQFLFFLVTDRVMKISRFSCKGSRPDSNDR
jgi:hypothetical protein